MWSKLEVEPELDDGRSGASEGSRGSALDGGGGGIPELAQAWESWARSAFPRAWNAAQGHRALSTSVGTRNVFASSSACRRPLSPSHSARHLKNSTDRNKCVLRTAGEERRDYARFDLVGEPADFERTPEKDVRSGGRCSISESGGRHISCAVTCKERVLDTLRYLFLIKHFFFAQKPKKKKHPSQLKHIKR